MILARMLEAAALAADDIDEDLDALYELEVQKALELRHFDRLLDV